MLRSIILFVAVSTGTAQAHCAGTSRDPLSSTNPRCDVSQFLDPVFGQPSWYTNSNFDRNTALKQCYQPSYPGVTRPPASWCRAALAAQSGR